MRPGNRPDQRSSLPGQLLPLVPARPGAESAGPAAPHRGLSTAGAGGHTGRSPDRRSPPTLLPPPPAARPVGRRPTLYLAEVVHQGRSRGAGEQPAHSGAVEPFLALPELVRERLQL